MIWSWDSCPGEPPIAWRVESAWVHQVASLPGLDDDGNLVAMPIYAWDWQQPQMVNLPEATVECAPGPGEVCAVRVTGFDEAGNEDDGADCS